MFDTVPWLIAHPPSDASRMASRFRLAEQAFTCRLMWACDPPLTRTPSSRITSVTPRACAAAAASRSGEYL
jgi:hypothetical protein